VLEAPSAYSFFEKVFTLLTPTSVPNGLAVTLCDLEPPRPLGLLVLKFFKPLRRRLERDLDSCAL